MDYIFIFAGTVLVSCMGIGLFRMADADIQKLKRQEEQEMYQPNQWRRYVTAAMVICNLLLAYFLHVYYGTNILSVIKVVMLCAILWVCAWTDLREYLILNRVLLAGLIFRVVLLAAECWSSINETKYIVISACMAAGILAVAALLCRLIASGSVGFGDVKLLIILGFYAGMNSIMGIMIITFLCVFVVSVVLLLLKKVNRKSVIPFAPFILAGTILAVILTGI